MTRASWLRGEQRLRIANRRDEVLAAVLHHPAGRQPGPVAAAVAVVAHGMESSKDSPKHVALCRRLAAAGVAALRFDFAGRGESEGDPAALNLSREVEDLDGILAEVAGWGVPRVALVGSSLGAAVCLLAAASAPERVAALATIACPAVLPQGARVSAEFAADAAGHDLVAAAARVRVPWLVTHGDADGVVPIADGERLAAAAGVTLVRFSGADHRFTLAADQERLLAAVAAHVVAALAREPS